MAKNSLSANRQVCEVLFKRLSDGKVFHYSDYCNTTGLSFSGDSVYANKRGAKAIAFANPAEASFSMEFQVAPFSVYSFFSNGVIGDNADIIVKETIKAETAGKLTLKEAPATGTTVGVYAKGGIGTTEIAGSASTKTFTATQTTDIAVGTEYDVVYTTTLTTGVKKIAFNNKTNMEDYMVQFSTVDKTEDGDFVGKKYTIYKASIQRNLDLSFSSDGDPASVTLNFDALEDKDGNLVDFIEVEDSTL